MTYERHVGFQDAVRLGFSNYFDFRGRAQRAEYWWFILFTLVGSIIATTIDGIVLGLGDDGGPVSGLFALATLIPGLSVGWRRLHDTGRSGLWILLPYATVIWMIAAVIVMGITEGSQAAITVAVMGMVAFLGAVIWVIAMLAQDSEDRPNRFGPSPKYDEHALAFA